MKSCAFVTTPKAWCVPRSLSLLTTNSEESTQIVASSRSEPSCSVTKAGSMLPVAIACSAVATRIAIVALTVCTFIASCAAERVGVHAGERAVVADRAAEHVRNLVHHAGVHDAVLDDPLLHRRLDRARGAHLVDRAHVQPVAAAAWPRRSEVMPSVVREDRRLDVVHADGVAGEQRADEAVGDEPGHVGARARVDERRARRPRSDSRRAPSPSMSSRAICA